MPHVLTRTGGTGVRGVGVRRIGGGRGGLRPAERWAGRGGGAGASVALHGSARRCRKGMRGSVPLTAPRGEVRGDGAGVPSTWNPSPRASRCAASLRRVPCAKRPRGKPAKCAAVRGSAAERPHTLAPRGPPGTSSNASTGRPPYAAPRTAAYAARPVPVRHHAAQRPLRPQTRGPLHEAPRQSFVQASVSTVRRMPSISSNVDWSEISGGASWMTGSPRSSARQYRPLSKRALERKP